MNTTTISFLAFQSFLIRSILAAASSLMGHPGDLGQTGQNQVWESPSGPQGGQVSVPLSPTFGGPEEGEGGQLSPVRQVLFGCAPLRTNQSGICLKVSAWISLLRWEKIDFHVLDSGDTSYILVLLLPQCFLSTWVCCGANCQVRRSALLYANLPPLFPTLLEPVSANQGWRKFSQVCVCGLFLLK